jgi:hypothetical protein
VALELLPVLQERRLPQDWALLVDQRWLVQAQQLAQD